MGEVITKDSHWIRPMVLKRLLLLLNIENKTTLFPFVHSSLSPCPRHIHLSKSSTQQNILTNCRHRHTLLLQEGGKWQLWHMQRKTKEELTQILDASSFGSTSEKKGYRVHGPLAFWEEKLQQVIVSPQKKASREGPASLLCRQAASGNLFSASSFLMLFWCVRF